MRHLADLRMKRAKLEKAKEIIQSSRALAQEGNYPELVVHTQLSEGHAYRLNDAYPEATTAYLQVVEFARQ